MIAALLILLFVSLWTIVISFLLFQCGCCAMCKKGIKFTIKSIAYILAITVSLISITYMFLNSLALVGNINHVIR